ncbi:hypothetical protein psyc5s11_29900 [Clostridium gelidum]|uniref:Uncharacterized protein n=1 Tax=Clostridium gelidum TaxID=704125 RepID=A0ABM7T4M1_9CLOT|nr:signal peptidase II [Clostridium gelidum]BCZ46923.1 hypothetical protein psyc5s11_29900 [Clostridium gelidum]
MSEFFSVTLDKDILLDDTSISLGMGWSSSKILDEIINHMQKIINDGLTGEETTWSSEQILEQILNNRITKFEELSDVDVINRKDKQMVMYSGDTQKFTTIDFETIGDAAGLSLKQVSKMGIIGSPSVPYIVDIPISNIGFKVSKVNVLKFQLGDQNVIKTENAFTNSESNDFIADDMIVFDGTAHLKTDFPSTMTSESDIDTYKVFSIPIDKSNFKSITSLNVSASGADELLNIKAMPNDRLLISKGDMNLSNASNIDGFTLTATGSNVRIICSVDGGITWKTFNTSYWDNIPLTPNDVKANGMTLANFNSISSNYWNLLITTSKIRFAYLLQDDNSIDDLKLQYDGQGLWLEAKNTEYDVIYDSNSLMQVKLYIGGDIKINY